MRIVTLIFILGVFARTISYAFFEIRDKKNRVGGIAIVSVAVLSLVLPIVFIFFV